MGEAGPHISNPKRHMRLHKCAMDAALDLGWRVGVESIEGSFRSEIIKAGSMTPCRFRHLFSRRCERPVELRLLDLLQVLYEASAPSDIVDRGRYPNQRLEQTTRTCGAVECKSQIALIMDNFTEGDIRPVGRKFGSLQEILFAGFLADALNGFCNAGVHGKTDSEMRFSQIPNEGVRIRNKLASNSSIEEGHLNGIERWCQERFSDC